MVAAAARFVAPAAAADLPRPPAPVAYPPPVLDEPWSRFYVSLRGGVGFLQDSSIDYVNGAAPGFDINANAGWAVFGATGGRLTPWLRAEIEGGGLGNDVRSITPSASSSGSVLATTLMFNGYVDIPTQTRLAPYVGAGFGKAWITHSNLTVDGNALADTTSWPFAYQFIAGARMSLAPRWDVSLEYRYLATQRGLFQDTQGLFYNADYANQLVLVGLTWRPR